MSINPVSDIVLDVARAANPSQSLAAAERLSRLGGGESAGAEFSSVMQASGSTDAELRSIVARMDASPSSAVQPPMDARTRAYKGIEELVLQNLVENMLPKEDSSVFGSGTAGDVWRSMLAEQLAKEIGKTVDLGLDRGARAMHGAVHVTPSDHVTERQS